METLHKYISESLFSNDEIGDQINNSLLNKLTNDFIKLYESYNQYSISDNYFKRIKFEFDEKNNALIVNFLDKNYLFVYNHSILKNLGVKIRLKGTIWTMEYIADHGLVDKNVFESLCFQNFNLSCYNSSNHVDNINIDLNMYSYGGYCKCMVHGGELRNIKNLNINIMYDCNEFTVGPVTDIDNIYFDNKSKKNNNTLIIYVVDSSLNEKKYYAMKNKFDYFCKFFKNINLNIAKNRNILNNEASGIIKSIYYDKTSGFKMNKNYA